MARLLFLSVPAIVVLYEEKIVILFGYATIESKKRQEKPKRAYYTMVSLGHTRHSVLDRPASIQYKERT